MIYFDHNATTPLDERVLEAMLPYLGNLYGNASSLYRLGRISKTAIDSAREQIAALVDCEPRQIIFTSGGTEANGLAMRQVFTRGIVYSGLEHPSVFENIVNQAQCFRQIFKLPVTASGIVKPDALVDLPLQTGDWLTLMLANNETGAIQSIAEFTEMAKARGLLVHCDAVQGLGKIAVSFQQLGVQLLSLSSHKIYGPKGCGALVVADNLNCQPLMRGGEQEQGWRSGTENVAAIVGFGKAAQLAKAELQQRNRHLVKLRLRLEQQLQAIPNLTIFAVSVERLPNTVQFAIDGINGEMLLMQLDRHNIAVSSGSACAVGTEQISPVLAAMAVQPELAKAAIRVSLGKDSNEQQIDEFVSVLKTLIAS